MTDFNRGYARVFPAGRLGVGLMTPMLSPGLADPQQAMQLAALADALGFGALWARDVPLMVPQGPDATASALDDAFLWLGAVAARTRDIAIGSAAIVLPLRHPLHVAKSALSLDRLSGGRFVLGLGSGDRPEEFAAFGEDLEARATQFRTRWALLHAALSPAGDSEGVVAAATGGWPVLPPPTARIPMLAVGTARQSLQWIARHAGGWATYHREETAQQGRIGLWQQALQHTGVGRRAFVQSMQLELLPDPQAPAQALPLGLRVGREGLLAYLRRVHGLGVDHVMFNLGPQSRGPEAVLRELGEHVLPAL